MSEIVTNVKRQRIVEMLNSDKRIDGRGLTSYREIKTKINLIEKANGSAFVSLGKTKVIVGVKVETGEPFSDRPDEGVLTTNVELVPLASPTFEPGPPDANSIELARVVDRGIRESKAVDLKKLCITAGEKVFVVFVDIYVLDHDGNLFDASSLASILALANTKIAEEGIKKGSVELDIASGYARLPVKNYPVEITMAKINNKILVDPSLDEENVADTQITMAIDIDGNICAMQKRGFGSLTVEDTLKMFELARNKSAEIYKSVVKTNIEI